MFVEALVETPVNLSKRQKEILREFENEGKNVMYITKNNLLKKTIIQNLKKQKNLKIIKKSIKDINTTNSTISPNNTKSFYDLILL